MSHSTGPRTAAGKAVSSLNRLVHGLAGGAFRVLPNESQEEFDAAYTDLIEECQPVTQIEHELVRKISEHAWLSRRAQLLLDEAILAHHDRKFALYLRYQIANERAFYNALNQFHRMRREQRLARQFESKRAAQASRSVVTKPPQTLKTTSDDTPTPEILALKARVLACMGASRR